MLRSFKFQKYWRINIFLQRRWYWRFRAGNGEIIAVGEAYNSAEDRDRCIYLIQREAANARIEDLGKEEK